MDISVVIPAYKEAENLHLLLPKIQKTLRDMQVDSEVLVVDTITPMDDTAAACAACGVEYINRRGGNHYGDAIRTGLADATGDAIVIMDADGSHDPADISRLYDVKRSGADLVIGSRYIKGGSSANNKLLLLMSWMVNMAYRVLFGLNVHDVSDSFRIYDANKLKSIRTSCANFDLVEEILIRLITRYPKLIVREVPIHFDKRMFGESKRDLVRFIFSYIGSIRDLLHMRKDERQRMHAEQSGGAQ